MLKDAFVESFSRLWNKLGHSWVVTLVAAVNPVFFWMVFQILWIMTGHMPKNEGEMAFLLVAWLTASLIVHVFPTSFAALEYLRGVYDLDVVYLRSFFQDYGKAFLKTFLRSIQLFVVFGVLGIMIGYALVFYGSVLESPVVRMVFVGGLFWVFVAVSLAEFVMMPMFLYNPRLSFFKAFSYGIRFAFAEVPMVGIMAFLDAVVFFLLSMGYGFALLTYYLFGLHFRLSVYKQLQKRYLQKQEESFPESEAFSQAWKDLLHSRKQKQQKDQ
ncbi:hypothetical protein [Thermospira aquatica]|uniref:ABC transporter permease n=1 Tax=Thermospira aquatica TaxID=2828656 RepID=A0AAX3BB52_9SPIR|nr:hypothetical protein [Thermospira aquatica]URA09527.1 hypothetical protein KDW03_08515 [Thermospira aquatica]